MSDPSAPGGSSRYERDDPNPPESPVTLSPLRAAGLVAAVLVGGAMLWLQGGLLVALGQLGVGGLGLQGSLSEAAEALVEGDYAEGEAAYNDARGSADLIANAAGSSQLALVGRIPGANTAVRNVKLLSVAAGDIAVATGELLRLYGDLSGKAGTARIFTDGAIDLNRLAALPDRVDIAQEQLLDAQVQLTAIRATTAPSRTLDRVRNKALEEMEPVLGAVNALDRIAPYLPGALGADGVRRYLVAIGNQAEMRAAGGAPLTLVLVEFDNGRISIPIKGQTSTQLFPPLNAPVTWFGPALNPFFPGNTRTRPFVVTNTHPNMVFSGREMAQAWEAGGYPQVDGVVTLDLTAIAAVLDATGPVESAAFGSVDGERIGQILLVEAYEDFGQEEAIARQQANQELLDALLSRLLGGEDLISSAQALASTAPGRHFQVWMRDAQLEQLAIDSGAAGIVEDPGVGDWSAIYTQNGNQSKTDVFQQRNVFITVNLAEDGSARVTQQVTMTNATPPDRPEGPPERIGYETSWVRNAYLLYVPKAARNYRVSYPGDFGVRPFRGHGRAQLGNGWVDDGFGNALIRVVGWTPPGGQGAVSVSYDLPAGTFSTDNPGVLEYNLQAEPQSLFINSLLTVSVTPPQGWRARSQLGMQVTGETATVSAVQSGPVNVQIVFRR